MKKILRTAQPDTCLRFTACSRSDVPERVKRNGAMRQARCYATPPAGLTIHAGTGDNDPTASK